MKAEDFSNSGPAAPQPSQSAESFPSAEIFLEKPTTVKTPFWVKAADFLTGHFPYGEQWEKMNRPEIEKMPDGSYKINVPESANVPLLQSPEMALAAAVTAGSIAAGSLLKKAVAGAQEGLGWMTGGVSDIPQLAKKGAVKLVGAKEAKNIAPLRSAQRAKGLDVPVEIAEKTLKPSAGAGGLLPEPVEATLTRGEYPGRIAGPSEPYSPDFAQSLKTRKALPPGSLTVDETGLNREADYAVELSNRGFDYLGPKGRVMGAKLERPGSKVIINGEEYTSKGMTGNNVILKDGDTIKVDLFDELPAQGVKLERPTMTAGEPVEQYGLSGQPEQTLLYGGGPPLSEVKSTAKKLYQDLKDSSFGKGVKEIVQKFDEPRDVLSKEVPGKAIYSTADMADLNYIKFLHKYGNEFKEATKGVKADSEASARIGQALDGKLNPAELSPQESRVFTYMKKQYDFLIQEAAKAKAGTPEVFQEALSLANQKVRPKALVSDLSARDQAVYKNLPTPEYKADYLHNKWKELQNPELRDSYDLLSRRVKDYLPHLFEKEDLLPSFKDEIKFINDKLRTATNKGAITSLKNRLRELEGAVTKLEGGEMITFEALPRNIRFKFFETRKGKAGYSFDSIKTYKTYLSGIARKIFDEPALKKMGDLYKDLSRELKPYAEQFIKRYSGTKKTAMNDLANAITSLQWTRTLGLNPRSAMVNLTQRVNTIADAGVKYSVKGEAMAFTDKGKALFDKTGLGAEIPQVLFEGGDNKFEKVRKVAGFMFNRIEEGNRRHAFLSGYLKAKEKLKLPEKEAIQYGIDTVHKTQFRYGRVGMPMILSNPVGRVTLQFSSYPIKQIRFLVNMARHEPKKFLKFLAIAEGGNLTLQEFADIDLSNALGTGVNFGEAIKVFRSLSEADLRGAFRHTRLAIQPGAGLLPSGPGPTASGAIKVVGAISEGKVWQTIKRETSPVIYNRIKQAYEAVVNETEGKYPIMSGEGYPQYTLTGKQLAQRTLGPMSHREKEAYLTREKESLLEKERQGVIHDITRAIVDNDITKANRLINKYQVVPSPEMIQNEVVRRVVPYEERKGAEKIGPRQIYQIQREGELVRRRAEDFLK